MVILSCRSIIVRRYEFIIYCSLCYLVSFYNVNYICLLEYSVMCVLELNKKKVILFLFVILCFLWCDVECVGFIVGISVKYFFFEYVYNDIC